MSIAVTVALIGGLVSVLVSVLGFVFATVAARSATKNAKGLEILKSQMAARGSLMTDETRAVLAAIGDSIHKIQCVREDIQLIATSRDTVMSSDAAIERLSSSCALLTTAYGLALPHLSKEEDRILHVAKNTAISCVSELKRALTGRTGVADLSDASVEILLAARSSLAESQQVLRDSRADKIVALGGL